MSDPRQTGVPAVTATTGEAGPVGTKGRPSFARTLTFFGFFAITASMVMTVYEYPSFASSGFQLVFFLIIGGILWFLPVALCAAEMATVKGWESGGIFAWVGNTLGRRWGFAALFFQWFQITVGFVTMAFFILAAFAYVVRWDALYNNPLVMFFGVAAIVWLLTLTQLGGTKYTARISKVGFVGGIIVPVAVLLVGLVIYFATGGVSQITMDAATFVPNFGKVDTLVIFASFILAYMGVEASASHVNELKNPNRNYPLAMIVLAILTILLDAAGGLAVATTLPASVLDGNLSFGVIEAFRAIFVQHINPNLGWVVFAVALLLALGVLAEISAWIVGPSRALLDTAHDGIIPPSFKKVNKHGVSVQTVVIQAIIVTVWDAVLCGSIALSGGSSSSVGYLTAIGLTVVIYLVGYVLFFLGYFVLIFRKKHLQRSFQLPGGTPFKAIVAGVGLLMTVATLVISFFPSSELDAQSNMVYQLTLGIAFVISVAIPFVIYANRHRWDTTTTAGVSGAVAGSAGGTGAKRAAVTAAVPSDPASANPLAGASPQTRSSTQPGATGNKRSRSQGGVSGEPRPSGASGLTRDVTGLGSFTAAVASVTRRPASPLQDEGAPKADVGGKDVSPKDGPSCAPVRGAGAGTTGTRDAEARERAAYEAEAAHRASTWPTDGGVLGEDILDSDLQIDEPSDAVRHRQADARTVSADVPTSRVTVVGAACTPDHGSASAAKAPQHAKDAGNVRDDLIEREAEGKLRSSVTDGVVAEGLPRADESVQDPKREKGPDTDGPTR